MDICLELYIRHYYILYLQECVEMGLFKDLFSKTANKLANEVIDNVKSYANDNTAASSSAKHGKNLSVNERIEKVVHECYPDYELKKNVSSNIFNTEKFAAKYTYTLSRFDAVRLTIMVLSDKNAYRRSDVVAAHNASENAGVHCINIMTYLPSTEEYIKQRIADNIK